MMNFNTLAKWSDLNSIKIPNYNLGLGLRSQLSFLSYTIVEQKL